LLGAHLQRDSAAVDARCPIWFGGWLNSDSTSCRCRVHFGSKADHHIRCRVKIYARPAGCIGTP
jgi:hypothetical protein